jgi:hypothetical protein
LGFFSVAVGKGVLGIIGIGLLYSRESVRLSRGMSLPKVSSEDTSSFFPEYSRFSSACDRFGPWRGICYDVVVSRRFELSLRARNKYG